MSRQFLTEEGDRRMLSPISYSYRRSPKSRSQDAGTSHAAPRDTSRSAVRAPPQPGVAIVMIVCGSQRVLMNLSAGPPPNYELVVSAHHHLPSKGGIIVRRLPRFAHAIVIVAASITFAAAADLPER